MARYHVQRSIEIASPPEQVFQTVADFGTWTTWSPWLCMDRDARVTISDTPSAVGSQYRWQGELVGEGEIEHKQLAAPRLIEDELRFIKPFRSRADVKFEVEPRGDATRITWHMYGNLPWFLFWMRGQMESLIGMDYDRGLKMLKEWIETNHVESRTDIRGIENLGPLKVVGIRATSPLSNIGPAMEQAFADARQRLTQAGIPTDGQMLSIYHHLNFKTQVFDFTSGFEVPTDVDVNASDVSTWSIPAVRALAVQHTGSYENLGNAWSAAYQYARYKKLKQSRVGTLEVYRNSPEDTAPADLVTDIFLPLK